MTCRRAIAIAALLAGCTEDVPQLDVTGVALMPVTLATADDVIPASLAHYRWTLVSAPSDANATAPSEDAPSVVVTPPIRGVYAYERWLSEGVSERVSLYVVLTVTGERPVAVLTGPLQTSVGVRPAIVATTSYSAEHRSLTFAWRLARRPAGSAANIADRMADTLTLTPDVSGDYDVELRVFDGELWSATVGQTVRVVP